MASIAMAVWFLLYAVFGLIGERFAQGGLILAVLALVVAVLLLAGK